MSIVSLPSAKCTSLTRRVPCKGCSGCLVFSDSINSFCLCIQWGVTVSGDVADKFCFVQKTWCLSNMFILLKSCRAVQVCRKQQLLSGRKELKRHRLETFCISLPISSSERAAERACRSPLAALRSFLQPLISNHHATKVAPYFSALSLHCLRCALRHEMEVNLHQSQWRLETTGSN